MGLLGAFVNSMGIVLGSLLGLRLHRISDSMKETVMNGMAITVSVLGVQMAFKTSNVLITILSICLGGVIGEFFQLENKLHRFGNWLEKCCGTKNSGSISEGFVTASLIYLTGAMGIIGALNSGITGNHQVQYTKAVMDGFIALLLSTSLGVGVLLAAVPVFIYQGTISIFASQIQQLIPKELMNQLMNELTATGGIMIVAIGLNILDLTKIRVANLIPSILVVCLIVWGIYCF